jgi:hypothetical protein
MLLAAGSVRANCPNIIKDVENDSFLGCCDLNGNPLAAGAPCVDEANPCKVGTCGSAGGDCVPTSGSGGNRGGSAACRALGNPCEVGDCSNGNCTGPFDLTSECAGAVDGNQCTDDCRPNDATSYDLFDVTCGPFIVSGLGCSIMNDTDHCSRGTCDAAANCVDNPSEGPLTCSGSLGTCERFVCTGISGGSPICEKVPKDIGLSCETSPKADQPQYCDPNSPSYNPVNNAFCTSDCKSKTCKDNGSCSFNYKQFQGWLCEKDAEVCDKGTCNSSGSCGTQNQLPNQRPCTPDNNICSWDECLGGVCSHTQQDPNVSNGTTCTSTNTCAEHAACQGASCVIDDCFGSTHLCNNCASLPCDDTGSPSGPCGCSP